MSLYSPQARRAAVLVLVALVSLFAALALCRAAWGGTTGVRVWAWEGSYANRLDVFGDWTEDPGDFRVWHPARAGAELKYLGLDTSSNWDPVEARCRLWLSYVPDQARRVMVAAAGDTFCYGNRLDPCVPAWAEVVTRPADLSDIALASGETCHPSTLVHYWPYFGFRVYEATSGAWWLRMPAPPTRDGFHTTYWDAVWRAIVWKADHNHHLEVYP